MIPSMLDNDLYKFTMQQAVFHQFPAAQVEYQFRCRNKADLRPIMTRVRGAIDNLSDLRFKKDELEYLRSLRFIKPDFIEFLRIFRFNKEFVTVSKNEAGELCIDIKGPWLHTILFEVPILAIVNECYFDITETGLYIAPSQAKEGQKRLQAKIKMVQDYASVRDWLPEEPLLITDFSTRRRRAQEWQEYVVGELARQLPDQFVGTSNVFLAKEFGLTPIGTMAHEWLQAMQAMVRVSESQKFAFQKWAEEYRGDLGIALSDIMGMDAFCRDFDLYFCKLFDGARHDSGDPFEWTKKLIAHYKAMRIDPKTKRAVYSDGLDIPKTLALHDAFHHQIGMGFGIGTNLGNDVGYDPLNIVIKMTRCNGQPVAKVSDARGKTICEDKEYLAYLMKVFEIK